MRVSKQIADQIAKQFIEETLTPKLLEVEEKLEKFHTNIAEQTLERDGLKDWKKCSFKKYLSFSSYVNVVTSENNHYNYKTKETFPKGGDLIRLNKEQSEECENLFKQKRKLEAEISKLEISLSNSLRSLGTVKKISENYPDLISYLPKDSEKSGGLVKLVDLKPFLGEK